MNYHIERASLKAMAVDAVTIKGVRYQHAEWNTVMATVHEYWGGMPEMEVFQRQKYLPSARLKVTSIEPALGKTGLVGRLAGEVIPGHDVISLYVQQIGLERPLIHAMRLYLPEKGDSRLTYFDLGSHTPKTRLAYSRDLQYFYGFLERVTPYDYPGREKDMERLGYKSPLQAGVDKTVSFLVNSKAVLKHMISRA